MERTWKPKAAGILCITLGVVCAPFSLLINMIITVVSGEPGGTELPIATIAGCWIIGGIAVITPIIGGIYALRRRMWGLALAGSICALILAIIVGFYFVGVLLYPMLSGWTLWVLSSVVCGIPGILAVIFVVRGKREFK
jgi:hypothetical protein